MSPEREPARSPGGAGQGSAGGGRQSSAGGGRQSSAGGDRQSSAGGDRQSAAARVPGFVVSLPQFSGPFDLLLSLIARRRLDVTELALAEVTEEFLQVMRADWELEHASEFLLVAATLLALKAHRLLPRDEDEEDEDLELIEARDLLLARLLQYRAFKEAGAQFAQAARLASRSHPREVSLPEHLAVLVPPLVQQVSAEELARIAARALSRPADPVVQTLHLHEPVAVGPQIGYVLARLREQGTVGFSELVQDVAADLAGGQGTGDERVRRARAVVVARFLALLILHREGGVDLAQDHPLGEISVRLRVGQDGLEALDALARTWSAQGTQEEFS